MTRGTYIYNNFVSIAGVHAWTGKQTTNKQRALSIVVRRKRVINENP